MFLKKLRSWFEEIKDQRLRTKIKDHRLKTNIQFTVIVRVDKQPIRLQLCDTAGSVRELLHFESSLVLSDQWIRDGIRGLDHG